MTDDLKLVERLRAHRPYNQSPHGDGPLVREAASAIERLVRELRIVQNAAETIASAHGTELEHLRQNHAFDHKVRAEHESLKALNSQLTDMLLATEADRDRLAKLVAKMREGLSDAAAHLAAASSAYRAHAARHRSVGRATSDPFFTTRVGDFDRAAERACTLLQRTQEVE